MTPNNRPVRRYQILNHSSRTERICKELQEDGFIASLSRIDASNAVVRGDWPMAITTNAGFQTLAMAGLTVELLDK